MCVECRWLTLWLIQMGETPSGLQKTAVADGRVAEAIGGPPGGGEEVVLMMIYKLDWIAYDGSSVDIVCVG